MFTLAELFRASLEATTRKLAELDLWPYAFVFWEEGFRKSERVRMAPYAHRRPRSAGDALQPRLFPDELVDEAS